MLLQRRVMTKDSWGGYWDISCAGHLTASQPEGEHVEGTSSTASFDPATAAPELARAPVSASSPSARSGAMRELAEELGLAPRDEELVAMGTLPQRHVLLREGKEPFVDNEYAHVYVYVPKEPITLSQFVLQEEEVSEVRWVPIRALVGHYCGTDDSKDLDEDIRAAGIVPLDDPQKYCSLVFSKWM